VGPSSFCGDSGPERWRVAEGFQEGAEEAPKIVALRSVEGADAVGLSFEKSRERMLG
jgi:hypothetical protein